MLSKFGRRSTKSSDKSDYKYGHPSIPLKEDIAIVPPKKVIKALFDHTSDRRDILSFQKGDFFHVVGNENATDWFEACNPVTNARGYVPVTYFEVVGKQVRNSTGVDAALGPEGQQHDSGYSEVKPFKRKSAGSPEQANMARRSSGRSGAMVYGIVAYDFHAERPDELEASAGDAIIVIAQSNAEWFVAKPIQRLGGPGLIPVSFVEIRDTTTGQPVADPAEAVRNAGVPKVEEWKKMIAEYKNSSIPLGRLESGGATSALERMSISSNARRSQDGRRLQQDGRSQTSLSTIPNNHSRTSVSQTSRNSQGLSPLKARCIGTQHYQGDWWYRVDVFMEDGRSWKLQRNYIQFFNMHTTLKNDFPEHSQVDRGNRRNLPWFPGPFPSVTEAVANGRVKAFDQYLDGLLAVDPRIANSRVVRDFFSPRDGDSEILPDDEGYRSSVGSFARTMQDSTTSLPSAEGDSTTAPSPEKAVKPPPTNHYRTASEMRMPNGTPPPVLRNDSSMTSASVVSAQSGTTTNQGVAIKIKVWFGDSNCVVLRMPGNFAYADLVAKIKDRYRLEPNMENINLNDINLVIECRDEKSQAFKRISGDAGLSRAREENEKLTLRVRDVLEMT